MTRPTKSCRPIQANFYITVVNYYLLRTTIIIRYIVGAMQLETKKKVLGKASAQKHSHKHKTLRENLVTFLLNFRKLGK